MNLKSISLLNFGVMRQNLLLFAMLLMSVVAMAQERTVTGTVKGDDNEPLVGASVVPRSGKGTFRTLTNLKPSASN